MVPKLGDRILPGSVHRRPASPPARSARVTHPWGSFFTSLLTPRRQVDVALHAVIMQAWIEGVSTRKVAELLRDDREDITAFADFPEAHWRKIWSTNPLERLSKEVKRCTDVVGIFPDDAAPLRLSACVLIEAHDEWQVSERRYLSESSMAQLTPPAPTAIEPRRDTTGGDTSEVIDTTTIKTA